MVSVFIFLFIWGIFQFQHPMLVSLQGSIKGWFTEDYDVQPVLKFFSDVGLWGNTLERAAFEATDNLSTQPNLVIPVSGQITSPFGWIVAADRSQIFHDGIIIAAVEGTPVKAALAGKVTKIANEVELGRLVEVEGESGIVTKYAHCSEILVNVNDTINAGQVIAKVGKTGNVSSPQLFFGLTQNQKAVDPTQFFIPESAKI